MIRQLGHPDKGPPPGRMVAPPRGIGDALVDEMHSIQGARTRRLSGARLPRASTRLPHHQRTDHRVYAAHRSLWRSSLMSSLHPHIVRERRGQVIENGSHGISRA
jgi:hypothetical protein